jgi:hypothetical protein
MKMAIFLDVTPCIALMMEAVITSETSINFCQTIRRNNPEDNHLHTRRRENLRSQLKSKLDDYLDVMLSCTECSVTR